MIDFKKGLKFVILNFALVWISSKAIAFECAGYLPADAKPLSPYSQALQEFTFPEDANFFVFERIMRIAMHEAHEGIDFYTGLPLPFDEMTLDHIIPRSKNGLDNVYNFVPTSGPENNKKGSSFTAKDLETLAQVRDIYGPKTMALLRHYGAFENRDEDYEKAKLASYRRKVYRRNREAAIKVDVAAVATKEQIVFRRKPEEPSKEVLKLILVFARELAELNEKEFEIVVSNKSFQFEIDENFAPDIDSESLRAFNFVLSHRKIRAKIDDESLAVRNDLFEIANYDLVRRNSRRVVNINFHPMFALKLLEMPVSQIMATEFLESFFRASDITREEFIEWSE